MTRAILACMLAVAAHDHLPRLALPAIQVVEGGWPGAVIVDRDGSADLGVMQINSRWVAPLARFTGWTQAIVVHDLVGDPCFNIAAAGAILRLYVDQDHGDILAAVGDYHSHTPMLHRRYLDQVLTAAARLRQAASAGQTEPAR